MIPFIQEELRRHRWIMPAVSFSAAAAFGSALPDIIALAHRVLS